MHKIIQHDKVCVWYLIVSMPDLCIHHYFYNAGKLTNSFQQLDEYFLFLNKFMKTFYCICDKYNTESIYFTNFKKSYAGYYKLQKECHTKTLNTSLFDILLH